MYELVDATAEEISVQDAARGVAVRVILDKNLEGSDNTPAYDYLSSHGVQVAWAPPGFDADHEKAMVVDTKTAWIMTLNLTSRYYSNTRDFAVEDTDAADVAAIVSVFDADFQGAAVTPGTGSDLVWSPTTSYADLVGLIESAKTSLLVENEEMENTGVVGALEAAARNGVDVEVVMNDTPEYADDFDELVVVRGQSLDVPGRPGPLHPRQGDRGRRRRSFRRGPLSDRRTSRRPRWTTTASSASSRATPGWSPGWPRGSRRILSEPLPGPRSSVEAVPAG